MLALSAKESVLVHEMKCNGAARAIAAVGGRTVPGERMMIMRVPGRNRAGLHGDFVSAEFARHRFKCLERLEKFDLISPAVRAGNHLHAPVRFIGVVKRNPSRD